MRGGGREAHGHITRVCRHTVAAAIVRRRWLTVGTLRQPEGLWADSALPGYRKLIF